MRQFKKLTLIPVIFLGAVSLSATANNSMSKGPVFKDYGPNFIVEGGLSNPKTQKFKVAFDIAEQGSKDKVNRRIESLARFINMHVRAGVPQENIELALVVHGKAGFDVLNDKAYQAKYSSLNPNTELLNLLAENNVKIVLCGQSAAYMKISQSDINSNVKVALSAMTAHANLQQQGYSLNPF